LINNQVVDAVCSAGIDASQRIYPVILLLSLSILLAARLFIFWRTKKRLSGRQN